MTAKMNAPMNAKILTNEDLDDIFITPEQHERNTKKLKVFLKNAERLILTNKCLVILNPEYLKMWGEDKVLVWWNKGKTRQDIFERMTDKKYHKINGKEDCWNIGGFGSIWSDTTINGERVRIGWSERPEGNTKPYNYIVCIDPHNVIE
jgi:hypothetical protein